MKRSGTILLCLACGMALSVIAQADSPSPATPNRNAAAPTGDLKKRIEFFKQRNRNFPTMGGPGPKAAPAPATNAGQPNHAPSNVHASPSPGVSAENPPGNPNNPYGSIATRNVFGLNPPTPAVVDTPQGPPPPKITLTGITTILGPTEALYKVSGVPQPGKPPKDESYILQEGQGQDGVVVQHIDMAKGIVTFNNNGVVQEIPLVAGVASGGATGAARGGGGFQPPQAAGFGARPNYNNTLQNFRQRMQQQRMGNQNGINPTGNNFNPSGQSSFNGGYNNPNSSTPQLSSDDAAALIAAQHAQLEQSGDPKATIFPPTKFDDEARQEAGGGGTPPPP